jgi:5-methylcytosine-specific restriction endonuclease McrA
MIRKEARYSIARNQGVTYVSSPPTGIQFHKALRPYDDPRGGPLRAGQTMDRRWIWVYKAEVYSTTENLDPDAVEALILEAENKVKVRVARAKALMVQARALDEAAAQGQRSPIPDDVKMYVWQRDGGKCIKCGSTRNLEYDHDIAFSLGGSNTARNIRLLCETCNRSKGGSLI